MCWINSWIGQNSRGPLSCISYLEKDSEDRRLDELEEESWEKNQKIAESSDLQNVVRSSE